MSETSQTNLPTAIDLPERALIAITGTEAAAFLNGLLTINTETLAQGAGLPSALLTPQGKVIADFLVFNASDNEALFLIDVQASYADDLVARLSRYKLRANVVINRLGADIATCVVFDAADISGESFYAFADPRHASLGQRLFGPDAALREATRDFAHAAPDAYHLRRTILGVPECGRDYLPMDSFPHEALLDQLGGIDFKKGCYVGQEIVSRMEHRGIARSRALPIRLLNGFGVMGGAEVRAAERALGKTGESSADRAISILRIDRLEEALKAGETLTAGGVPCVVSKPGFIRFDIPGVE